MTRPGLLCRVLDADAGRPSRIPSGSTSPRLGRSDVTPFARNSGRIGRRYSSTRSGAEQVHRVVRVQIEEARQHRLIRLQPDDLRGRQIAARQ